MSDSPYDVFISYRRATGSSLAQLVRFALQKRGFRVFVDVRELVAGPFDAALKSSIEKAENFVVLLTPGCLDRCADEKDWLRQEITVALNAKRNIVPLKTEDFQFPPTKGLPRAVALLTRHNCVTYVHEHSDASLDKLCRLLRRPKRANRGRLIAGLTIVALIVAAAGVLALHGSRTASPPPRPPSPSVESVDLLALVDIDRDRIAGQWSREQGWIVGQARKVDGRNRYFIVLPWDPPAEYRLRIKVTRITAQSPMLIGLAAGAARFNIAIDWRPKEQKEKYFSALEWVDNRQPPRGDGWEGRLLPTGVPMELLVTVRPNFVRVDVEDKKLFDWHGDLQRASRAGFEPNDPLVVGGFPPSAFRFERIVLEPLGPDRGTPLEKDTK